MGDTGLSTSSWTFVVVLGGMAIGALCVGLLRRRWALPKDARGRPAPSYVAGILVGGIVALLLGVLAPAILGGAGAWALPAVLIGMFIGALVVSVLSLPGSGVSWQVVGYTGAAMLVGGLLLGGCALTLRVAGLGAPRIAPEPAARAATFTPLPLTATLTLTPTLTTKPPTPSRASPTPSRASPTPSRASPTPKLTPTSTPTATLRPTHTPTVTPTQVVTFGGKCLVWATFSKGEGECDCPEGFEDTLEITVSEEMAAIQILQPSTGDRNTGTLNPVDGSFEAESQDGNERYSGYLYDICRGEGWNEYYYGCWCKWGVEWEPVPNE